MQAATYLVQQHPAQPPLQTDADADADTVLKELMLIQAATYLVQQYHAQPLYQADVNDYAEVDHNKIEYLVEASRGQKLHDALVVYGLE